MQSTGQPVARQQSPVAMPALKLQTTSSTKLSASNASPRMGVKLGNVRVSLTSKNVLGKESPKSKDSARPESPRSGILGMLTPRSTPREPELKTVQCYLITPEGEPANCVNEHGMSTLGFEVEGATVTEIQAVGWCADWGSYSFKEGDVIISIGGVPFESAKPIHEYLVQGKRATRCEVQRWVTPSRFPLTARVMNALELGTVVPDSEEEMEGIMADLELVHQHPEVTTSTKGIEFVPPSLCTDCLLTTRWIPLPAPRLGHRALPPARPRCSRHPWLGGLRRLSSRRRGR